MPRKFSSRLAPHLMVTHRGDQNSVTTTLARGTFEQLSALATARGLTRSELVRELVLRELESVAWAARVPR